MLSDEVIEKVVERLVNRIEQGNEYIMKKIGESVKKIGTLSPSRAQELVQILRYGGDYDKIVKKLAEITKLNKKDIYKIFNEIAKSDYNFAEQFYKYRNKKFIPYEENIALKQRVNAIAKITADTYQNISNTMAFARHNARGEIIYSPLAETYQAILDEAIMNVGQGKETFDSAMYRSLKTLADKGINTVDYESGRHMRLDSALRMQMNGAIRDMHIQMQEELGKSFNADGVEISVHMNPAPDHELVQGKQFSISKYDEDGNEIERGEFEKFQNDEDAVSYDGVEFSAESEETGRDRRSIGQYNCYHYTFAIVLGVNKPQYTNEQLKKIVDNNNKGFEYEGKHYTNYEGQQLQRNIELAIRKAKDQQILGRSSDNKQLINKSQEQIDKLNRKYKKLSKISGLLEAKNRMRVPGYKRVAKSKLM